METATSTSTSTATATVRASDAYSYDARSCYCTGLPYRHTYADCAHLWRAPRARRPRENEPGFVPTEAWAMRELGKAHARRCVARKTRASAERDLARAFRAYERARARYDVATRDADMLESRVRDLTRVIADLTR